MDIIIIQLARII